MIKYMRLFTASVWRIAMNWFMNLKIGKKLGLGFGLIELLMIAMGGFAIGELGKVNGSTMEIANNWLPSIRALAELKFDASSVRRDTLNFVVAPTRERTMRRI